MADRNYGSGFKMKWGYSAINPAGEDTGMGMAGYDSRDEAIDEGTRAVHNHLQWRNQQ